jgi:hypothetical protein
MKKAISIIICIFLLAYVARAQRFLSGIIMSESDKMFSAGTTTIPINYWRFDTCLYGNSKGSYNISSSVVSNKIIEKVH